MKKSTKTSGQKSSPWLRHKDKKIDKNKKEYCGQLIGLRIPIKTLNFAKEEEVEREREREVGNEKENERKC